MLAMLFSMLFVALVAYMYSVFSCVLFLHLVYKSGTVPWLSA